MAAAIPNGTFKIANYQIPNMASFAIKVCSIKNLNAYYSSMFQINAIGYGGMLSAFVVLNNSRGNANFVKNDIHNVGDSPNIYILSNGNLFDIYVTGTYKSSYNYGGITVIATDNLVSFDNTGQIVSVDSIKDDATLLT